MSAVPSDPPTTTKRIHAELLAAVKECPRRSSGGPLPSWLKERIEMTDRAFDAAERDEDGPPKDIPFGDK